MGAEWRRSSRVQGHMLHVSSAAQSYLRCVPPKQAAFYRPTPCRAPKRAAFCRPTPRRPRKRAAFYSPTPRRCPKRAAFCSPTPRRPPKRAAFCRPTPRRCPKRAAFYRPTPRRAPKRTAFHRPTPRRGQKRGLFFTVPGCAAKKAAYFAPFLAARSKTRPPFTPPNSWGDANGGRLEVYPVSRWAYRASASRSGTWRLA